MAPQTNKTGNNIKFSFPPYFQCCSTYGYKFPCFFKSAAALYTYFRQELGLQVVCQLTVLQRMPTLKYCLLKLAQSKINKIIFLVAKLFLKQNIQCLYVSHFIKDHYIRFKFVFYFQNKINNPPQKATKKHFMTYQKLLIQTHTHTYILSLQKIVIYYIFFRDTILGSKILQWKIHMPAALTYNLCDDK